MNTALADSPAAIPAPVPTMSRGVRIIITVCVMSASLMQTLDSTIANVALPYMQGAMSASQEEINWVLTSYIVAAAIMTAPTGFLAARFGMTRLFVTSILGFTFASILCGLAQSLDQIVLFRVLQGVFGAGLVPLSQAVVFDINPPEKRSAAMAIWGTGVMIGPVIGPILGGWLTQNYSWRWVFYINVPFGLFAAAGLIIFLKETSRNQAARLDWLGFLALGLGVGALQMMLDRGETLDWFWSHEIVVEACVAGLGIYVFLVQLSMAPKPFLNPLLFTDLNFVVGVVLIFINGLIMYATLALLAPYLQIMMNYPVVTAGIVLAPRGAGVMLAAMIVARFMGKIGARTMVGCGLLAGVYALYRITSWTPDVSEATIFNIGFIQGLSVGFLSIPLNFTTFLTLPGELRTEAAGVFSLMRNLGSAVGISVTGAMLVSNTQINHAILAGAISPFNRLLQSGAAAQFWNPTSLQGASTLDGVITRQASIIAYTDNFKMLLVVAILALPLALLLRPLRTSVRAAE